jgi:hypothetical protein
MTETNDDIRIVVLPRGWVVVGKYAEAAGQVVLTRAMVVRRWGTTKGLGEITAGPTKDTKLDALGELRCAADAVLFSLLCTADAWTKVLPA